VYAIEDYVGSNSFSNPSFGRRIHLQCRSIRHRPRSYWQTSPQIHLLQYRIFRYIHSNECHNNISYQSTHSHGSVVHHKLSRKWNEKKQKSISTYYRDVGRVSCFVLLYSLGLHRLSRDEESKSVLRSEYPCSDRGECLLVLPY
jgi:hypothetical protein